MFQNYTIKSLYSLYDFTIYSPETLIKRTNPRKLTITYLTTAEENRQAKKLLNAEKEVNSAIQKLPKTDKMIYLSLKECASSYEMMLRMFRQFYTIFNQRNVKALEILRDTDNEQDAEFDKKILACDKEQAPQIKNVLMNFARSYVRFSKQYVLLVQGYINALRNVYKSLPTVDKNTVEYLKYISEFLESVQKTLVGVRGSMIIIQSDQDEMIAKFMKTLLNGVEKCWVGDIDLDSFKIVFSNFNTVMERIDTAKVDDIDKKKEGLILALEYNAEPLKKWVEDKARLETEESYEKKPGAKKSDKKAAKTDKEIKDDKE